MFFVAFCVLPAKDEDLSVDRSSWNIIFQKNLSKTNSPKVLFERFEHIDFWKCESRQKKSLDLSEEEEKI